MRSSFGRAAALARADRPEARAQSAAHRGQRTRLPRLPEISADRQALECLERLGDLLGRVLVVLERTRQVALVGRKVEVAVAAQVEEDDPRVPGFACLDRLVNRDLDRV